MDVSSQLETLLDREEIMWAQKAQSTWIIKGYRNTKYFQTIARNRRLRNRITQIKAEDGSWLENIEEIKKGFTNFYQEPYQSQQHMLDTEIQDHLKEIPLPSLTESQKADLNKPILRAEIAQALFQIGALKAPVLDGLRVGFYQQYWSIVQNDVISAVQAFFHLGYLLKSLNHTFLSLIPKVAYLEEFSHF